jgi:DNA-binding transcriptional LysR family regulator
MHNLSKGYAHNADVMEKNDHALISWAHRKSASLNKVTVGQLVTLLELCGSASVAAMGGSSDSDAINYRQKLDRLEKALGVGRLTRIEKNRSRPNELGQRIAGEVRLLLREIQAAEQGMQEERPTWIVGAGSAWLQSAIVPALIELSQNQTKWRWEVRNLRAEEICRGLKLGEIHFGFVRTKDAEKHVGIELSRPFDVSAYAIIAGKAEGAPARPAELLQWLVRQKRPLVQQGSTWIPIRKTVEKILGKPGLFEQCDPQVTCDSHTQAAVAVLESPGWCIVPASLAKLYKNRSCQISLVAAKDVVDEMALATYSRVLTKLPDGLGARDELRKAVGTRMGL